MRFIYGQGGYGREIYRNVVAEYPNERISFIDDNKRRTAFSYEQAKEIKLTEASSCLISFADPKLRMKKTKQVKSDGFKLYSVKAATALIGENVDIGEGSVISDFSMITCDTKIGVGFHCNIYSYIAHDCVVGDFVTLAPRVSVNGRVEIEDCVYIGTGATILPGADGRPIKIGSNAIIGAHALVTSNVPKGVTVVGTPAKVLRKAGV